MPRDGTKNLTPLNKQTKEKQREITSKGGVASGKARREKRDLRKALQMTLNNTYIDSNGNSATAVEIMARNLVAKAMSGKNRDAMAAIKYICELTGMNKTPEQKKREKTELKLLEQELKLKERLAQDMEDETNNEIRVEIVRATKKSIEEED